MVCAFEIPTVSVVDYPVGTRFQARDGVILTVVSVDYSNLDNREHTLTLSDGEEERTYGKNWWAWAMQYRDAAQLKR